MKFKEKLNQAAGFTLVELIVVIAILAILAGVAVPAYSGYIEKANLAADQQLLAAVNKAFAAACAENGVDISTLTISTARIEIDATSKTVKLSSVAPEAVRDEFETYYTGNESAEFEVYKSLIFNPNLGMFEGSDTENAFYQMMLAFKDKYADILDNVAAFGGNMGIDELMYQLADVTGIAAGMATEGGAAQNALNGILNSDDFKASAMAALGTDAAGLQGAFNELVVEMLEKNPNMTQEEAFAQVQANAAVLYTAKMTADMPQQDVIDLFNEAKTGGAGAIANKMTNGDAEGIAQAALVCGLYTAYTNRNGIDAEVNVNNVLDALANDTAFQNYLNTPEGQADLAGYLGSMQILSGTADGSHAAEVENLMLNGFGDADLIAALGGLVG